MSRLIFHIDVNNAFLSWTAVDLLEKGYPIDIRTIPSVIGGDESKRKGIVTAKSPVAKDMGIVTAEPLFMARRKCPNLKIFSGDYDLYRKRSNELYKYFCSYTPAVERFSIDECFLDMTGMELLYPDPIKLAYSMKDEIYQKFGYTVNIGIANNKLCAKMASDFEKPNKVHTLFQDEIRNKMWPLPVSDLLMVGKSSSKILMAMGIKTIGDLAKTDPNILKRRFGGQGQLMYDYANGIDYSTVNQNQTNIKNHSISVSETLAQDIEKESDFKKILLRQADSVGRQARKKKIYATTITVIFKTSDFIGYSHQQKLVNPTNATEEIYKISLNILNKGWKGDAIRLIGIRLSDFTYDNSKQVSLFDQEKDISIDKIQTVIDDITNKFGDGIIMPASLKEIGGNSSNYE